jgi:2-C-methyl-D-erythritol 4-phosphate cytidylyltransferase
MRSILTPPTDISGPGAHATTNEAAGVVAAIVVAAGRGHRFGAGDNKVLVRLDGRPIWVHSVETLASTPGVDTVVLVVHPDDREGMRAEAERLGVRLVDGGRERVDSVLAGVDEVERLDRPRGILPERRWVAIHDAARPLVPAGDLANVLGEAFRSGAAILAAPLRGTIKLGSDQGKVSRTVDRSRMWEALTPQVFRLELWKSAHRRWRGRPVTDDAELVERSGFEVSLVPGSAENLKITHPEDLVLAEAILARRRGAGAGRVMRNEPS